MKKTRTPFGLLFEEPTIEPQEDSISPEYDAFDELSYVFDATGQRVPYVTRDWASVGTQTGTSTKMQQDSEDTDPSPSGPNPKLPTGTQTVTAIRAEATDTD